MLDPQYLAYLASILTAIAKIMEQARLWRERPKPRPPRKAPPRKRT